MAGDGVVAADGVTLQQPSTCAALFANRAGGSGLCAPAHPYREFGVCSLLDGLLELQGIAAVETHNGGNVDSDNELAIVATRHMALPGLGGSDCHKVAAVGRCATEFLQPVTDMASLIAAVRAGACRGGYFKGFSAATANRRVRRPRAPDQAGISRTQAGTNSTSSFRTSQ